MNGWQLPNPTFAFSQWSVLEVLLEFNGPQLTLLQGPNGKYLSVAVDEDESSVRWLRAQVEEFELEALFAGAATVRDLVDKTNLFLVDESYVGVPQQEWQLSISDIEESKLPTDDSYLPTLITSQKRSKNTSDLVLSLFGKILEAGRSHLSGLSKITLEFQKVWRQLCPEEPVTFYLLAYERGSARLTLDTDEPDAIPQPARRFRSLVVNSVEYTDLSEIRKTNESLIRAYSGLVDSLLEYELTLDFVTPTCRTYLSQGRLRRVAEILRSEETVQLEPLETVGYFEAFNMKTGHFTFLPRVKGLGRIKGRATREFLLANERIVLDSSHPYLVIFGRKETDRLIEDTVVSYSLLSLKPDMSDVDSQGRTDSEVES